MSDLKSNKAREKALLYKELVLGPDADAAKASINASHEFAIGSPGDSFMVAADDAFHMKCDAASAAAVTANHAGPFTAGQHGPFVLPDDCASVYLIAADGTGNGVAWKVSP